MSYEKYYLDWKSNQEKYWEDKAKDIHWFKKWDQVLKKKDDGSFSWFENGQLNTCFNCIDRHVIGGNGKETALIYDSTVTGKKQRFTYEELLSNVSSLASSLHKAGVRKGDRIIIYMPMIPQVVFSMLACARIGAIHSVVFGGFSSNELANRIDDAKPKIILSASCGIEIDRIINYKEILDNSISLAQHLPEAQIILQREEFICDMKNAGDIEWSSFVEPNLKIECVSVESNDPLYILYTSGTTGIPKGIVRTNGGHAVALLNSMKMTYGMSSKSVYWAASDVGWVVGHSYIVYAPLLIGCTTVLYEGKPVGTPDAGQFWRIISDYGVNCMFTAPTAIRAIKKVDPYGNEIKKYNLSSLKSIFLAGERADPESIKWTSKMVRRPVIDHLWQTETGWSIAGNFISLDLFPIKAGSTGKPAPGFDVVVLDDNGKVLDTEKMGNLAIRMPLPPGCSSSIWNDNKRFYNAYLKRFKGFYDTSDAGIIDKEGYISVMSRTDDIINCAGHRISTGSIEEILTTHEDVAECAVVGIKDNIKGEVPLGLLVLNNKSISTEKVITEQTISLVRKKLGPVASYKKSFIVTTLPKTRSGKILRSTISKILNGFKYDIPATIEDADALTIIEKIKSKVISS